MQFDGATTDNARKKCASSIVCLFLAVSVAIGLSALFTNRAPTNCLPLDHYNKPINGTH